MRAPIDPVFLDKVRTEYRMLGRAKDRRELIEQSAANANVSLPTFYRQLNLGQERPRKKRTVAASVRERNEALDNYGREVFIFAMENTFDHSECGWNIALEHLQTMERIPQWVTNQQIYKAISRQDLVNEWSPVSKRHERDHAMSMFQCDFSTSRHIKHVGEGRLMVRNPSATKMTHDRRRLWFGVAVDDASRVMHVEYFLAPGESAIEAQKFLMRVFSRKPVRTDYPNDFLLQGIPQSIYVDRGSGWIDGRTQIGLARMGVQCIIGANEKDRLGRQLKRSNKKARGKVEKAVQTVKSRFEMMYSLKHQHGAETTLAELNHDLWEWLETWNQGAHPTRRSSDGSVLGKWNMFSPALSSALYSDENTLALFTRRILKKVRARLINVQPNLYCIAPTWADDGQEIEIVSVHGFHYAMKDGGDGKKERIPLEYQEGSNRTMPGETLRMQIEEDQDVLEGFRINERFDDELQKLTGGTIAIRSLPDAVFNEIEDFFTHTHTVLEIKRAAADVVARIRGTADQETPISAILINPQGGLVYEA